MHIVFQKEKYQESENINQNPGLGNNNNSREEKNDIYTKAYWWGGSVYEGGGGVRIGESLGAYFIT